jgi:hypothetical protein
MSKSVFLRPLRLKTERFPLPEIGEDASVTIRELPAKDLLDLRRKYGEQTSDPDFGAEFLALALVDDEGKLLFDSASECKEHITNLPVSVLERLHLAALKLSGLSGRIVDEDGSPKN